jgi:hypothetical protein
MINKTVYIYSQPTYFIKAKYVYLILTTFFKKRKLEH